MKKFTALILLLILHPLAFSLSAAGRPPVVSLSHPNILFVSIDDFNDWGPTQLDGEPFDVDTPNFDSLAAELEVSLIESEGFIESHFGAGNHESEPLLRIGPLPGSLT